MAVRKNKKSTSPNFFIKLAYEQAKINLGSTGTNPSVGCILEKNGTVLSSGHTSLMGRPHAEFNTLKRISNYNNSNLYLTLEPCSHYGKTPPCIKLIKKNKINRVFISCNDFDERSYKLAKKNLQKKKIIVAENFLSTYGKSFYLSYALSKQNTLPLIDAKIAVSKDFYTINKKKEWISNFYSRQRAHLIRSFYDCIISTSKSINEDSSILDCRINGLENKSPDVFVIDRYFKLKKRTSLLKNVNRKIYILTTIKNVSKKRYFEKRGFKIIIFKKMNNFNDYRKIFMSIKNKGYSRLLVESGLELLNFLISNKLINYLYFFQSNIKLNKSGKNYATPNIVKKLKLKGKINVNLFGNNLYKINLK